MKSYLVSFIADTTDFRNPLPKLKMTGRQSWKPKAQNYSAYKMHILKSCIDALDAHDEGIKSACMRNFGLKGKVFDTSKKLHAHMVVHLHFADKTHGDPENCFGSIADALFLSDKYLSGEFYFEYTENKKSYVEVEVTIQDP